ncbi:hypothetical protein ANN_22870, partial [Periplaneta americana]
MAGLCEGGNEPPGSLKAITYNRRSESHVWPVRDLVLDGKANVIELKMKSN